MPIHDWRRVDPGLFHDFHQSWVCNLSRRLNAGLLPRPHFAMLARDEINPRYGAMYPELANRVAVHRDLDTLIAVIEVVSPEIKHGEDALRSFAMKMTGFLRSGAHALLIDLFPPRLHDPRGVHDLIWGELANAAADQSPGKRLVVASYSSGITQRAYIEPLAVGDPLPDMPLFLTADEYVMVPLEATYQETWAVCPEPIRELVEPAPGA